MIVNVDVAEKERKTKCERKSVVITYEVVGGGGGGKGTEQLYLKNQHLGPRTYKLRTAGQLLALKLRGKSAVSAV